MEHPNYMIFMVFLPLLWPVIFGHLYDLECGSEKEPDFTIEPSDDGVLGRYLVQWCSQLTNPAIEKWTLFLYIRNVSNKDCEFYKITDKQYIHSRIEQKINKTFDCPAKICISTYLDLVYTGCYTIRNEFYLAQNQRKHDYRLRYITSGLNSVDDINNLKSVFVTESLGDNILLKIDSRIPLTDYYVRLCSDERCSYIERACSVSRARQLWAAACRAPPPAATAARDPGTVRLAALVSHVAPWTHGVMFQPHLKDIYMNFSYSLAGPSMPDVVRAGSVWVWAVCAVCAVCAWCAAGALAGLLAARAVRRRHKLLHHRYNSMMCESAPSKCEMAPPGEGAPPPLVVVYSREAGPGARALAALVRAVRDHYPGTVETLYSGQTAAACGGQAAGWARGMLSRGARVLLLQTPALLASTKPGAVLPSGNGGASTPFGSQFGDTLVSVLLRCLSSAHADTGAYNTYYVANLCVSECEVVPLVAPYRRYELPAALPLLLSHLAPGVVTNTESMAEAMQQMSSYLEFVRENPDYLQDLATPSLNPPR